MIVMSDAANFLAAEDTVEYRLYPAECDHEFLTRLAVECTHFAKSALGSHIWNYESFRLAAQAEERGPHPPHLFGTTCYRDNVEDEWLIVYLLFALSRQFEQLVISVSDSDGEFLLIEAAHHLPKWLKPETAKNRVFIHRGKLHVIPKPRTPGEVTLFPVATPTIKEAIRLVGGEASTEASEDIQEAIQKRISCFPAGVQTLLHRAHCYLPYPAAHVMSHDPQLVAAVVHALCDRDLSDMQACRQMETFSPKKHSCIMAEVVFTRCLYAQLLHQQFSPPRNSGFTLPAPSHSQHKSHDLGMKLTCGLEILLSRVGGERGREGEDVTGGPRWDKFMQSLKERGYFRNELEGSRLHRQLLETAREYFLSSVARETDQGGEEPRDPLVLGGRRVAHILQTVPFSEEEVRGKCESLKPPDDDSWLEISPEQLDEMMRKAAGYLPREQPASSELDLESMVFGMKSFVEKVSTHKGAEFPWSADDTSEVQFDPNSFLQTVEEMLDGKRGVGRGMEGEEVSGDFSGSDDLGSPSDSDSGLSGRESPETAAIMQQMDQELATTEVGKSFEKATLSDRVPEEEEEEEEGGLQPVDVDFNLVRNLLESYSSQEGLAGPASNILQSLGVHIPKEDREGATDDTN